MWVNGKFTFDRLISRFYSMIDLEELPDCLPQQLHRCAFPPGWEKARVCERPIPSSPRTQYCARSESAVPARHSLTGRPAHHRAPEARGWRHELEEGETCVSKPQRRFLSSALLFLGLLLVTCALTPGHWRSETPELRRVG